MPNSITILFLASILLISCSSPQRKDTLRELDVVGDSNKYIKVYIKPKTTNEIKNAYMEYLKHASSNTKTRMAAISRLADIEFDLSNKILETNKSTPDNTKLEDIRYQAGINKTIELLTTTLQDYPNEKTNDRILYQLSKAYEQNNEFTKAITTLQKLSKSYPKSPYYIEAQFRIGEAAFSRGDYITAEDAYTEVISSKKNELYFEKSKFKRAWSRFKQNYYMESVDDILSVISFHDFGKYESLDESEKSQFNEYYRLLGLSFAYAGGIAPLHEYLKANKHDKLNYLIHLSVSNVYLNQERYTDAVSILLEHIKNNTKSDSIPLAQLKIIDIWNKGGFSKKVNQSIRQFYLKYNPDSTYWNNASLNTHSTKLIRKSLKHNVLQMTVYYHKSYQTDKQESSFNEAKLWYARYFKNYSTHAHKDNIYYLYAELLATANKTEAALNYYEKSAYDTNLILDKNAAYATIISTSKLVIKYNNKPIKRNSYINKHIEYSTLFSQLYPNDNRTASIITHAAELAFSSNNYTQAIKTARLIPEKSSHARVRKANIITAHSYFKLNKFNEAEELYTAILKNTPANSKSFINMQNNLALSIYRQGEAAKAKNNISSATYHFSRITKILPTSDIAATGLYDAIALYMSNKLWGKAIDSMKQFQLLFPKHKYFNSITKNLSVAYLNSNQGLKAAQEFEKLSNFDDNKKIKKTALLQAAELYETKENYTSAIRSYKKYVNLYKKPFTQYMESMHKLLTLNRLINKQNEIKHWRKQIMTADKRTSNSSRTERTRFITSSAFLSLAREKDSLYRNLKLIRPLKKNFIRKKKAMQLAVELYARTSSYRVADATTESTYAIASIYNDFSDALLNSDSPRGLNASEQEQYKILIEDRAFPFEEKSIEFHELNMLKTKDNTYNKWVDMSLNSLKKLFPVRYNRVFKIDEYINVLH